MPGLAHERKALTKARNFDPRKNTDRFGGYAVRGRIFVDDSSRNRRISGNFPQTVVFGGSVELDGIVLEVEIGDDRVVAGARGAIATVIVKYGRGVSENEGIFTPTSNEDVDFSLSGGCGVCTGEGIVSGLTEQYVVLRGTDEIIVFARRESSAIFCTS